MVKRIERLLLGTIVCVCATAPTFAGTVYLDGMDYNHDGTPGWWGTSAEGWSGAFTATTTGVDGVQNGVRFETFCLEKDTNVNVPGTYTAVVNDEAVYGGGGGGVSDPLDPRTAWLYNQWVTGELTRNDTTARDVAWAIWAIEDEWTLGSDAKYDGAKALIAEADGKWDDIGNVRVLNLWNTNGSTADIQDILVTVPLPGSVLLGVFAVGLAVRKLCKVV